MKIHHIRNATMVVEIGDVHVLIDPMLGKRGAAGPPFTLFRFPPKRNPIVDLPDNAMEVVRKSTHCLLTHLHPDHLDKEGENFLKSNNIPVICSIRDEKELRKRGLSVVQSIDYWKTSDFLGGSIEGIPATNGYGFVAKPMGNVMGYYIKTPNGASLYLISDTIYTPAVAKVLQQYRPSISVLACGSAQLDLFKPLLMTMEDILRFVRNAPGKVVANHLESVNHCPTTRKGLKTQLHKHGLLEKTWVPNDGEVADFSQPSM